MDDVQVYSDHQIISQWKQGVPESRLMEITGCSSEQEFADWLRQRGQCYGCNK